MLARPLAESGFPPSDASALRVEAADDWRWGSVEAAFLARVVRELGREISEPALVGVPAELKIARARRRAANGGQRRKACVELDQRSRFERPTKRARLEHICRDAGRGCAPCAAVCDRRAKVRGAEVFEVLAESSSRALTIVAVVNLLIGAILAFVGAVQLSSVRRRYLRRRPCRHRIGAELTRFAPPSCSPDVPARASLRGLRPCKVTKKLTR